MSLAFIPLCKGYFFGFLEATFIIAPSVKYGTSPSLVPSVRVKGLPSSLATMISLIKILSFLAN